MHWKITDRPVRQDNPSIDLDSFWKSFTDLELRYVAFLNDPAEDNPYGKYTLLRTRRKHLVKDLDGWDFIAKPPVFSCTVEGSLPQKNQAEWQQILKNNHLRLRHAHVHYRQTNEGLLVKMADAYQDALTFFTKVVSGKLTTEEKADFNQKEFDNRLKLVKEWPDLMKAVSAVPKLAQSADQLNEDGEEKSAWERFQQKEDPHTAPAENFNDIDSDL